MKKKCPDLVARIAQALKAGIPLATLLAAATVTSAQDAVPVRTAGEPMPPPTRLPMGRIQLPPRSHGHEHPTLRPPPGNTGNSASSPCLSP